MAQLHSENEILINKARDERDKMLKDAAAVANNLKEVAKTEAREIGEKLITDAKSEIVSEKNAALTEVRNQVITLSIEIAEKLLRQSLGDEKAQKVLVEKYLKDKSLN